MTIKPLTKVCSVAGVAFLVIASLVPANWLWSFRTELGWQIEHFLAFFMVTSIVCLAWPRPFAVGAALMVTAALLEGLQALTPDRTPNLLAVFCGAAGALAAALLAELFIRVRRRRAGSTSARV
jgi:VanZ family protein